MKRTATPALRATIGQTDVSSMQAEIDRLQAEVKRQKRQIETLANMANRDALTGLYNRRGFEAGLIAALSDHHRYGHNGAILMLDLNKFKPINDTYGHAAGDALLIHVANLLKAHTRESDLIARLGGDEFVVVLREATNLEAMQKASQLALSLRSTPCIFNGAILQTSASVGVVTFQEGPDATELLNLADKRMYKAKHGSKAPTHRAVQA